MNNSPNSVATPKGFLRSKWKARCSIEVFTAGSGIFFFWISRQSIVTVWNLECRQPPAHLLPIQCRRLHAIELEIFRIDRAYVNSVRIYRLIWDAVPHIECLREKVHARSMMAACQQKCHHIFEILGIRRVFLCISGSPHRMPPKTYTHVIILLPNISFLQ